MDLVLPANFDTAEAPQILEQAREILKLPPDTQLQVVNVTKSTRGTRIDFSITHSVTLDDQALSGVAGLRVDVHSNGNLRFNARGCLVSYQVKPEDPRELRAITDHLSKLVANGEVYVAQQGEQIDPEQLQRQGKAWYILQDEQGNKVLKRAWIS